MLLKSFPSAFPTLKALLFSELALVSFPLQLDSKSALEAASSPLPLLLVSLRSLKNNGLDDKAKLMLTEAAKTQSVVLQAAQNDSQKIPRSFGRRSPHELRFPYGQFTMGPVLGDDARYLLKANERRL